MVYKVDRLSRSLLDFARILEQFEKRSVSFVAVTQQINSASSMGRLMLNVLLSFAQFEREIISERTRDKIAAARRKGKWAGGHPVLGYDILSGPGGSKLLVNEDETARVRQMFELYLEHEALMPAVAEINRRGWRTKSWSTKKGNRLAAARSATANARCAADGPVQGPHDRRARLGKGFEYEGKVYRSLSAIARAVTGSPRPSHAQHAAELRPVKRSIIAEHTRDKIAAVTAGAAKPPLKAI